MTSKVIYFCIGTSIHRVSTLRTCPPRQKQPGIIAKSYGALTPILRHPLKSVFQHIAARLSNETGKDIGVAAVLLLWTRQTGGVAVSASANANRIKELTEVSKLMSVLPNYIPTRLKSHKCGQGWFILTLCA